VDYNALPSLRPIQFLLTLHNPLFDPIRITLATPSHTPGRFASKVTILCPEFEIGANTDVWDEALSAGGKEKRRTKAESSEGQAEAGKIWEKGRNWTTVVLEVVPASLDPIPKLPSQKEGSEEDPTPATATATLVEDDDVLEIPLFVRAEYEADVTADGGDASGGIAGAEKEKEKRELAYWCVLGVGRIAHSGTS
jgi:dynactin-4